MHIKSTAIVKLALPLLATATLCAGACKSDPDATNDAPKTPLTAAKDSMPTNPANAQVPTKEWNQRRIKEFADTSDEKLGTLADGIGIAVGQPAPSATVANADGKSVELSTLWQDGSVLLVFYRGGWCPYCNSQMRDLTMAAPEFAKRGITPAAISVDTLDETDLTKKTYEIPFPLLSDPELVAHNAWNVTYKVDDAEFERLKSIGIDVGKASGKEHRTIGIPSMFLVDKTGTVLWAHGDPAYKVRPRASHLLRVLDANPDLTLQR